MEERESIPLDAPSAEVEDNEKEENIPLSF